MPKKTRHVSAKKGGMDMKYYGILFSHKKKTNPTICNIKDGARGYCAQ